MTCTFIRQTTFFTSITVQSQSRRLLSYTGFTVIIGYLIYIVYDWRIFYCIFRLFILFMVGVSIAWVPVIKEAQGGQIFVYIQEVMNYLAPPFTAVYLLALLVPRINETVSYW